MSELWLLQTTGCESQIELLGFNNKTSVIFINIASQSNGFSHGAGFEIYASKD